MAEFKLVVRTAGQVFEDNPDELVRILRLAADQIECDDVSQHTRSLFDINGNRVGGYVEYEEE